jgi:hypothetical protein
MAARPGAPSRFLIALAHRAHHIVHHEDDTFSILDLLRVTELEAHRPLLNSGDAAA